MTDQFCTVCGQELPPNSLGNRCPACLLDMATEYRDERVVTAEERDQRFGDYELLEEIARGGMGVVFRARQISLNRIVALKRMLTGQLASRQEIRRFRGEAEAAAKLRHPNIVTIYQIGEEDGLPYFSMEYVQGRDLAAIVRSGPLPAARAARYVELTASAVEHAHRQGVLHRDLKPSNVLIDAEDQPRVTDFGLAKQLSLNSSTGARDQSLTLTGQLLGSPSFMAPEQTSAKPGRLGAWTDVYGLGAILYVLLTGRPPFQADALEDVIRQLHEKDPIAPRLLNASLPRDLETICLKSLEKDPKRRYASARELADDLGRFSRNEPIHARPAGKAERLARWCRRRPLVAGLLVVLQLTLVVGAGLVLWQSWARQEALLKANRLLYASDIQAAYHAWQIGNHDLMRSILDQHRPPPRQEDLRGFEWRWLWRLLQNDVHSVFYPHSGNVTAVSFLADGLHFATLAEEARTARVWTYGNPVAPKFEFTNVSAMAGSPCVSILALGRPDGAVSLRDVLTGNELGRLQGQTGTVRLLSFSPDGQWLAESAADKQVRLWTATTHQLTATLQNVSTVLALAFSPDGNLLATSSSNVVCLWDLADRQVHSEIPISNAPSPIQFAPDGRRLAIAVGHEVLLWDIDNQQFERPLSEMNACEQVAFLPQGRMLAAAGYAGSQIWDLQTRQAQPIGKGHKNLVSALAAATDGRHLALGKQDGVWMESVERRDDFDFMASGTPIRSVAFSPDSRLLAVGGARTLSLWDLPTREKNLLNGHTEFIYGLAFSPDGRLLVSSSDDNTVKLWDTLARTNILILTNYTFWVRAAAFSPEDKFLATGQAQTEAGPSVRVWDLSKLTEATPPFSLESGVRALGFSPDGKWLAAGTLKGRVTVWDTSSWRDIGSHSEHSNYSVHGCLFLKDGKTLVTADNLGRIALWDFRHQGLVRPWRAHASGIRALALSPDGRTLASGGYDRQVILWNTLTWRAMATLEHPSIIWAIAFSPDGHSLATGTDDGVVRLWQAAALRETDRQ